MPFFKLGQESHLQVCLTLYYKQFLMFFKIHSAIVYFSPSFLNQLLYETRLLLEIASF